MLSVLNPRTRNKSHGKKKKKKKKKKIANSEYDEINQLLFLLESSENHGVSDVFR